MVILPLKSQLLQKRSRFVVAKAASQGLRPALEREFEVQSRDFLRRWYKQISASLRSSGFFNTVVKTAVLVKKTATSSQDLKNRADELLVQTLMPLKDRLLASPESRTLQRYLNIYNRRLYDLGAVTALRSMGVVSSSRRLDLSERRLVSKAAEFQFDLSDAEVISALENRSIVVGTGITAGVVGDTRRLIRDNVFLGDMDTNAIARTVAESHGIPEWRGLKIARTEAQVAFNSASNEMFRRSGVKKITWVTVGDNRVREGHQDNDGVTVEMGRAFPNGQVHPGDGADSINCRCGINPDLSDPNVLLQPWDGHSGPYGKGIDTLSPGPRLKRRKKISGPPRKSADIKLGKLPAPLQNKVNAAATQGELDEIIQSLQAGLDKAEAKGSKAIVTKRKNQISIIEKIKVDRAGDVFPPYRPMIPPPEVVPPKVVVVPKVVPSVKPPSDITLVQEFLDDLLSALRDKAALAELSELDDLIAGVEKTLQNATSKGVITKKTKQLKALKNIKSHRASGGYIKMPEVVKPTSVPRLKKTRKRAVARPERVTTERELQPNVRSGAELRAELDAAGVNERIEALDRLEASHRAETSELYKKLDTDSMSRDEVYEWSVARRRLVDKVEDERDELISDFRRRFRKAAKVPKARRGRVAVNADSWRPQNMTNATNFLEDIIDKDVLPQVKVRAVKTRGGAYHQGTEIHVNAIERTGVVVHEIGHHIEDFGPDVISKMEKFFDSRTVGEATKGLRKATGKNYKASEVFKEDKWISPYWGKVYDHRATELVSMGLEMLYDNPYKFMAKDPELFDFLMDLLRSKVPKGSAYSGIRAGGRFASLESAATSNIKRLAALPEKKAYLRVVDEVGTTWTKGGKVVSKEVAETLDKMKIPPSWSEVRVAIDPKDKLQAIGFDKAGRTQRRYSAAFNEANASKKFQRGREFSKGVKDFAKTIATDASAEAKLMEIELKTSIRVGKHGEARGKIKSYGLTTLEKRHVIIKGNHVTLDYIGKEGVHQVRVLEASDDLVKFLKKRMSDCPVGDCALFADMTGTKLNSYIKKTMKGDYSIKDFRTFHGTRIANESIAKSLKVALKSAKQLTVKEGKAIIKQAAIEASDFLGNNPQMAINSYIDPVVWEQVKSLVPGGVL